MANFATDFHYKRFQIQADDGAFYSFTLVVQQVKSNPPIQTFLDAVSSESGESNMCDQKVTIRDEGSTAL